jgi:hypothetical protein
MSTLILPIQSSLSYSIRNTTNVMKYVNCHKDRGMKIGILKHYVRSY